MSINSTLEAPAVDAQRMAEWMAAVDERLREMSARIAGLEARAAGAPAKPAEAVKPVPVAAPAKQNDEIPPEVLLVISAASAAFLGKKARIRRVRRVQAGMNPWSQQGRVNIQASHNVGWNR
jgi:methylmalonyl-CoA carboxyltransferase large subunit